MSPFALIVSLALGQTPPATTTPTAEERAAAAAESAERAAKAAQAAAESAAKAAEAAQATAGKPAAPAAAPAATPAAAPAPSNWTATVGLGLISLTGNTRSLTFNGNAVAEYKTENWIFGGKASAVYGQSRPEGQVDTQVLAEAGALQGRADRRFSKLASAYLLAGIETDHVKSLEYRALGEVGAGLIWLDNKEPDNTTNTRAFLRTDLGVRYAHDARFQYFPTEEDLPDVTLVAPKLGAEFRYDVTKDLLFVQTLEVMTNVWGESRTLVNSLSKISVHLVSSLSIGASFTVGHDSAPAPGKLPTDTALAASLEYSL